MIRIAEPGFDHREENAVLRVLRSGRLSQGALVAEFENAFADFIGVEYAIAVVNGTAALHLALLALEIGKGDEVITTPFSFAASSNAILFSGAKPVFVDVEAATGNIDPKRIEKAITKRTKALLPVHLYGLPASMPEILQIAKRHRLSVIEDAAQAHGASIQNKRVGSFGDIGCFSFYATKNMTTGEGGMLTTNRASLAKRLRLLRNHGSEKRYFHDILGYNFRMTDIVAALGLVQLKKLTRFNQKRQSNAKLYTKTLSNIEGLLLPYCPKDYEHVFHQYTIRIDKTFPKRRQRVLEAFTRHNIETMIYYPLPIHKQVLYRELGYFDSLPIAEQMAHEVLSLPVHPMLTQKEILRVCAVLHGLSKRKAV